MRPLLVTAIAGSVLALSACGGGAEPPEAAPPSSSGTPSESPSASGTPEAEVTLPAEVQGTSKEAAKQTVLLFIDEINRAGQNGDTRLVRQLFTEDCQNCETIVGNIESIYEAGGSVKGDTWVDLEAATPNSPRQGIVGLSVRATYGDQVVREDSESDPESTTGGVRQIFSYTVIRQGGRWMITTINISDA